MKAIELTQGMSTLVDDADYESLSRHTWVAAKITGSYYAVRHVEGKPNTLILMHRQILGLEPGDKQVVDHADHVTLNNSRFNIRVCTGSQNNQNMRMSSRNTSGFKGVSVNKSKKSFRATIGKAGRNIYLGTFLTAARAGRAYDEAAMRLFGQFACTNSMLGKFSN